VEPFFGGGSIGRDLLTHINHIAINDYDFGIAAFWHSVMNSPEELCEHFNKFEPTIEDFYKFKEFFLKDSLIPDVLVEQKYSLSYLGFMKVALHQISFSGLGVKSGGPLGGAEQKSKYKIDCRWNSKTIENNIWKYHNQFKKIKVFNQTCSYFSYEIFIENVLAKSKDNFIYLDPPYYEKGPELYQFSFDDEQHSELAKLLRYIDCPWLLSYDNAEEIREMYKWAEIKEIDVNCTINTKSGSTGKKELLIVNKNYKYLLE
jgi:DNA adenine methylase